MATYSSSERAGVWNSFQIMLVDVDDSNDDVNIIVNYGSMRNENDQGYCITGSGCNHVAIGLGNVSGDVTIYNSIVDDSGLVLNGMATDQLRDGGEYALSGLHLNSEIPGRFIFHMENGSVEGSTVDAGPGCTDETAANYLSGASSDDGSCKYGVANLSANTDTNGEIVLTWDAPLTGDLDDMLFYSINYTPGGGAVTGLNTGLETHTLSNLSNATAYTINVCAVYNVNNTDVTACKQISATTNTVNTKPTFGGGGGGTYTSPTLPTTPTTPPPVVTPPAPTLPTREKSIYDRALEKGITTMSFENVRFEDTIQRYEAAKMIVNYVLNVE